MEQKGTQIQLRKKSNKQKCQIHQQSPIVLILLNNHNDAPNGQENSKIQRIFFQPLKA